MVSKGATCSISSFAAPTCPMAAPPSISASHRAASPPSRPRWPQTPPKPSTPPAASSPRPSSTRISISTSTLSLGLPRMNRSGTLLEGIALWGELKPHLTVDAIYQRAKQLCLWSMARGTLGIRSHVDICDDRLLAVEALIKLRDEMKPYLDIQLVAFPAGRLYPLQQISAESRTRPRHGRRCRRRHPAFRAHHGRRR